jgi:tripartite-type tricarboxylate transporter receptor subunit TctC
MKRRHLLAATAAALTTPLRAQTWPDRPIRVIVPNPAGGGTDILARLIQRPLEQALGQPAPVQNVAGGGTSIGNRTVRDAAPDGHTVLFIHQALLSASAMGVQDFGPDAFEPVAQTGIEHTFLVVNGSSPFRSFSDVLAAARAQPNALRVGVQIGALNHLNALALSRAANITLRAVNTGGGGPTRTAILGNHVELAIPTLSEVRQFLTSGQLRALAAFSPSRMANLTDVPTARELGVDAVLPVTYWWWMPRGVPAERVARFADALERAMATDDLRARITALEIEPLFKRGPSVAEDVARAYAMIREAAQAARQSQ